MENNITNDSLLVKLEKIDTSRSEEESDEILPKKTPLGKKMEKKLTELVDDASNVSVGKNNSLADISYKDCIIFGNNCMATNNGQLVLGSKDHPILSTHTIGKSGNAIATPTSPEEYLIINFNGNLRKIPLYLI